MQLSQSKGSALLTAPRGSVCTSSALLPQDFCQPLPSHLSHNNTALQPLSLSGLCSTPWALPGQGRAWVGRYFR